jgi:hypothetical protein
MLIGGDFNVLRFSEDKNKNFTQNRYSDIFNRIINLYELRDLALQGGSTFGVTIEVILHWKNRIECSSLAAGSRNSHYAT